jgi:hypothetical protein
VGATERGADVGDVDVIAGVGCAAGGVCGVLTGCLRVGVVRRFVVWANDVEESVNSRSNGRTVMGDLVLGCDLIQVGELLNNKGRDIRA